MKNYTYLGTIEEVRPDGWCRIEQKNKFSVGEAIEVMKPDGRNVEVTVRGITDERDGSGDGRLKKTGMGEATVKAENRRLKTGKEK